MGGKTTVLAWALAVSCLAAHGRASAQQTEEARSEPTSAGSFRLSPGLGTSSAGTTARIGGELEFWLAENLGLGAVASAAFTTDGFEDGRSYLFVGPAVAMRSEPRGSYATLVLALGLAAWSCDPGPCDEERETERKGLAAALKGGYVVSTGGLEVGGSGEILLAPGHLEDGPGHFAFTVNLELGFGIASDPPAEAPKSGKRARAPRAPAWRNKGRR